MKMQSKIQHSDSWSRLNTVVNTSTPEETQQAYSKWAEHYNEDLKRLECTLPDLAAKTVMSFSKDPSTEKLFDIGAGTGLVGVSLRKLGFKGELQALDANFELLEKAKKTGIYSKYILQNIVPNEPLNAEGKDFDFVCCIAALGRNDIPPSSVTCMVDLLKKGGMVIYSTRVTEKSKNWKSSLDRYMENLVKDGVVEKVNETDAAPHYTGLDPNTGKEVISMMWCYKKL